MLNSVLNDDVSEYLIANFLQISDVQKCSSVSKEWKEHCDQDYVWKTWGTTIGLKPPSKNAKKYKTWRDIIKHNMKKICRRCQNHLEIYFAKNAKKK